MNIKDKNIYLKIYGSNFGEVEAYREKNVVLRNPLTETQKLYRIVEVEEVTVDVTIRNV